MADTGASSFLPLSFFSITHSPSGSRRRTGPPLPSLSFPKPKQKSILSFSTSRKRGVGLAHGCPFFPSFPLPEYAFVGRAGPPFSPFFFRFLFSPCSPTGNKKTVPRPPFREDPHRFFFFFFSSWSEVDDEPPSFVFRGSGEGYSPAFLLVLLIKLRKLLSFPSPGRSEIAFTLLLVFSQLSLSPFSE